MRQAIAAAEASGAEVARERASHVSDVDDPLPILRSLRRVRSDVALLSRATAAAAARAAGRAPRADARGPGGRPARRPWTRSAASLTAEAPAPDLAAVDAAIAAFEGAWAVAEPEIDAALRGGDGAQGRPGAAVRDRDPAPRPGRLRGRGGGADPARAGAT